MLNRSGITKTNYGNLNQILANVDTQLALGCIVPSTMGVDVDGRKIVKAGTPLVVAKGEYGELNFASVSAWASGKTANAVLVHDVDVTTGNANGTALYFGVVNINCVDDSVKTMYKTESFALTGVTLVKC